MVNLIVYITDYDIGLGVVKAHQTRHLLMETISCSDLDRHGLKVNHFKQKGDRIATLCLPVRLYAMLLQTSKIALRNVNGTGTAISLLSPQKLLLDHLF